MFKNVKARYLHSTCNQREIDTFLDGIFLKMVS